MQIDRARQGREALPTKPHSNRKLIEFTHINISQLVSRTIRPTDGEKMVFFQQDYCENVFCKGALGTL